MEATARKKAAADLTKGPVAKTLIMFSLPFMVSTLLQTLYSTVDTIVVGQFLGKEGLAGVSNGSQIMQMIYMLCIGFANAGQVLIAQYTGAKLKEKVQHVIGTLFFFTIAISLGIGVICLVFAGTRHTARSLRIRKIIHHDMRWRSSRNRIL
ncbi:MAG: MATE family efflux transporter [Clostridia bacterium]|nr:MATE family efflux transporter [Clostridia bacterium]